MTLGHRQWTIAALALLLVPALTGEAVLRVRDPLRRDAADSLLAGAINEWKNRALGVYLTEHSPVLNSVLLGGGLDEAELPVEVLTQRPSPEYRKRVLELLFATQSTEIRSELEERFAEDFARFAAVVADERAKFVAMYLPVGDYRDDSAKRERMRRFYAALTADHGVEYWNLAGDFEAHPPEDVTYLPNDGHLNPAGHELVAEAIARRETAWRVGLRSRTYEQRPSLLGDLEPDFDRIYDDKPQVSIYRLVTNSQGLRGEPDLEFPKRRQRVLFYGDSMTIGYWVNNEQTWAARLNARFGDVEFVNAGASGWTISDCLSSYRERGRYIEADVVVLVLNDDDLGNLLDMDRRRLARDASERVGRPLSAAERMLLRTAADQLALEDGHVLRRN